MDSGLFPLRLERGGLGVDLIRVVGDAAAFIGAHLILVNGLVQIVAAVDACQSGSGARIRSTLRLLLVFVVILQDRVASVASDHRNSW